MLSVFSFPQSFLVSLFFSCFDTEFKSVMMFRQQHQMKNAFDKSDIYIICRMSPLSYGISHCEDEIARCEWMKLSTLITHTDTGPITRLAARLAVYGMKNGFQNVDLEPNRMRSWVDPNKTVCLYHRYLPSWWLIPIYFYFWLKIGWKFGSPGCLANYLLVPRLLFVKIHLFLDSDILYMYQQITNKWTHIWIVQINLLKILEILICKLI